MLVFSPNSERAVSMGGVVDKLIGGIFGKAPKVDTAPANKMLDDTAKNAKKSRAQVLATMGGVSGMELTGDQVSKQGGALFGN